MVSQARAREEQQREKSRGTRARGGYRGRSGQADILVEDVEALSDEEEEKLEGKWKYKVLAAGYVRKGVAMDSEKAGKLTEGDVFAVTERQELAGGTLADGTRSSRYHTMRVKFEDGWASVVAKSGKVLLELVEYESKDGTDGGAAAIQAPGDEMEGLYGEWQTSEFVPPAAENGKVPRGEHGNVELWDKNPALMPGGCCHVEAPWIQQTCNELNIDFAECVTDFKYSVATGGMAPKVEGIVICADQHARLMAAHATKMAAKQVRAYEM